MSYSNKAPAVDAPDTGPAYPVAVINAATAKARAALENVQRAEALAEMQRRRGVTHGMYERDAQSARNEARRTAALLKAVLDEAEEAVNDAWVDFWFEQGKKKLARIDSLAYRMRLRMAGHFGGLKGWLGEWR